MKRYAVLSLAILFCLTTVPLYADTEPIPGTTATQINGATLPVSTGILGTNASGQIISSILDQVQTVTETSEAATCNWNNGSTCVVTAEANTTAWTLTFSNPVSGRSYAIYVTQQTGGPVPLPTLNPTVTWADGAAPVFSGTNTKHDAFICQYVGTAYYCVTLGNNF